jgi:hypothetical protein
VSEIGKPVLIKTSFFPNWKSHGADGPYRAAELMVVADQSRRSSRTAHRCRLAGRFITLISVADSAPVTWKGIGALRRAWPSTTSDRRGRDTEREPVAVPDARLEPEESPIAGGVPPPGPG